MFSFQNKNLNSVVLYTNNKDIGILFYKPHHGHCAFTLDEEFFIKHEFMLKQRRFFGKYSLHLLDHFSKVGSFPPMSRCSSFDPLLMDALVASRTNSPVESVRQHVVTVVAHSNLNVVELLLCLDNTVLTSPVASLVVPAIIDYYNINCWKSVPKLSLARLHFTHAPTGLPAFSQLYNTLPCASFTYNWVPSLEVNYDYSLTNKQKNLITGILVVAGVVAAGYFGAKPLANLLQSLPVLTQEFMANSVELPVTVPEFPCSYLGKSLVQLPQKPPTMNQQFQQVVANVLLFFVENGKKL